MIKRKIKSLKYHFSMYLFHHFGIPKKQNEQISKRILKKYLPKNPLVIDCGAHDGADSIALLRTLKGSIHCFEPVPFLYERLKSRTAGLHGIWIYQLALGDKNGFSDFNLSEGESDGSGSLLQPLYHLRDHPQTVFRQKVKVETKTLDDWAIENKIFRVDLLWLDMQGFEMNMLQASRHILDTVKVIHTEVSTRETYKGVAQYGTYKAFLEKKGFKAIIEAIPQGWDMGNVLFVRK